MKENDTYQIACVLDPRIKTNQLQKNISDPREIISRIKKYLIYSSSLQKIELGYNKVLLYM